ncbi:MAG: hypothetical protein EOO20_25735 [Chryseobacterium sp.]|nr:MAG: hypothetical protein EOO20_25735 [Chryseobacterium sp.]
MVREIERLQDLFFSPLEMVLSDIAQDTASKEYVGYHLQLDQFNIKFRKAKITPKKIGQFVTLWERNSDGITTPFHESSTLDFALILTERNEGKRHIL